MYYDNKIWIGSAEDKKVCILPKMANRHGLIAGATGTGKTVTLKVLAESFSSIGVPVFMADVKGDLSGMCKSGTDSEDMQNRIRNFGLGECGFTYREFPTTFWDVYGKSGIPLRTTISEMGPVLLSKLMNLNDTQADILSCLFKMADDEDLLLVDIKDLKAILNYAAENASELSLQYGNMTKQSIAAIIRNVVSLEAAGAEQMFTEPGLNIVDFFGTDINGMGKINVLDARALVNDATLYSAFLLWMLSEIYETLPEVGDLDKPRMVFFFDEAHLLFDDISKALQDKIEQIIKLIRSKGVGIYFITQSPKDIPDAVLAQLQNKIQHALHAYTPAEEKAVKAAADSFRTNPNFNTKEVLTQLGVGEALVSVLDEEGTPTVVERCKILPPQSYMGAIGEEERGKAYLADNLYLKYKDAFDPDSAYEFLERQRTQKEMQIQKEKEEEEAKKQAEKEEKEAKKAEEKAAKEALKAEEKAKKLSETEARKAALQAEKEEKKKKDSIKRAAKSVASTTAGTIGREVGKNLGGSIGGSFGKKVGGNVMASLGRSIMGTLFK